MIKKYETTFDKTELFIIEMKQKSKKKITCTIEKKYIQKRLKLGRVVTLPLKSQSGWKLGNKALSKAESEST